MDEGGESQGAPARQAAEAEANQAKRLVELHDLGWNDTCLTDNCVVTGRRLVQRADLEVDVRGVGEPVLFVQTALTADELLPIAQQPVLVDRYRRSSITAAATPAVARRALPGRSSETPRTLLRCSRLWESSKLTLSGSPSAVQSPCSWHRLFPTACTASS
jgi:hypothetical protein